MYRIIITTENTDAARLQSVLAQQGFVCSVAAGIDDVLAAEPAPHLALIETASPERAQELSRQIKQARPMPVIALIPREVLSRVNGHLDMDDFVIKPYDITELVLRVKRLVQKAQHNDTAELIKFGDMVIDQAKCEVAVGGRLIELTYREYELLKFLASHRGRVFTREALLDRVWGYDFYGGDRTVDVHIRRLRSKIEDATHEFIETVRNIGYRFVES